MALGSSHNEVKCKQSTNVNKHGFKQKPNEKVPSAAIMQLHRDGRCIDKKVDRTAILNVKKTTKCLENIICQLT